MPGFMGAVRGAARGGIFPALAVACFGDYFLNGSSASLKTKVDWLQRSARRHAKWIGLEVQVFGEIPRGGLIVANHVSYLDILGLSSVSGCAFVAKKEVAAWPVFGAYAEMGGTIFLDRERRGAVVDVADSMRGHLDQNIPVVLFPEGTSTDGTGVLPFRTSLFEPVVRLGHPVVPCGLRYSIADGSVRDEVAYWGDMSLIPHLPNLLTKSGLKLEIRFGSARIGRDRKELARSLHAEVCELAGVCTR
jgi:1-acyl-sn-glycerol-3-phosphate acyltransferase